MKELISKLKTAPTIVVGCGHRSGHGKDTFCDLAATYLNAVYPKLHIKKQSFAWELKLICHKLYSWAGVKHPQFYEENREARKEVLPYLNMTVVDLWVSFGTDAVRDKVYSKTWVYNLLFNQRTKLSVLFIPDVRFFDEVEAISSFENHFLLKVTNPEIPDRVGKSVDDELKDYDGWTLDVTNDSDIASLSNKAIAFCQTFLEPILEQT